MQNHYISWCAYGFAGKTITRKVTMFTQDSKSWKLTRGHLPLGLNGSIRTLKEAKLWLSLEDIQSHTSGM